MFLIDGSSKILAIPTTISASGVCDLLAERLEIAGGRQWGLYEKSKKKRTQGFEFLFDFIDYALERLLLDTDLPVNVMERWTEPDTHFLMKYRLIFRENPLPVEQFALHLLYTQVHTATLRFSVIMCCVVVVFALVCFLSLSFPARSVPSFSVLHYHIRTVSLLLVAFLTRLQTKLTISADSGRC